MRFASRLALCTATSLAPCQAFAQQTPASAAQPAEDMGEEPGDAIIVQATRSGHRLQDEPVRVEVIDQEELDEKVMMRPGNIAMVLGETGGLRVQVTSPALGAANVRVQGMDGRYTLLLADGLPLYGGQTSSLGLLQIPPTDLGQVEVIKGAASALYGPSALGGMINLISRRPGDAPEAEVVLNASSRGGQDATAYTAAPIAQGLGASLTGGYHRQTSQDIDDDGWIDMAAYERWSVRPRLFWEGAGGATAFLTAGAMTEQRQGGSLLGKTTPDGRAFPQTQDTDRFDGGLVAQVPVGDATSLHIRGSAMTQKHRHLFGDVEEKDRHTTLFAEVSLAGKSGGTSWVGGAAYQRDSFNSQTFAAFNYAFEAPGVFGQVEQEITGRLTLASSARVDFHSTYGTRFSPRLSLLYRPGRWTIRASGGRGFYAPTPFVEEIEAAGLSRLEPLGKLKPETATTRSLDVGYARGPIEANVTLFASDMNDTTRIEPIGPAERANSVRLVNVAGQTRIRGSELLLRYRRGAYTVTGSYVYVDASEPNFDGSGRRAVPLTPLHTAGLVAMWEEHDKGRLGLEVYYTGKQPLEDNPYRTSGKPYFEIGLLGEIVVGKARLFLNAENLLGIRQTRYDSLLRPRRAPDGRWTVDAWAPLEGFALNGGIRLRFGGGEH